MKLSFQRNATSEDSQAIRCRELSIWKIRNGIKNADFARIIGKIGPAGAGRALRQERIKTEYYNAIVAAYPDLPVELLPRPEDVRPGPKPGEQDGGDNVKAC